MKIEIFFRLVCFTSVGLRPVTWKSVWTSCTVPTETRGEYSLLDTALNSLAGGGVGIHRRDPARNDFDYGAEYRAKVGYSCTCVSVALVTIPCLERLAHGWF